jgi:uncharacterized membrane protein YeaQ/YmgE (transglycosylase-associated protein family)
MWMLVVLVSGGVVGWLASYIMRTGPQSGVLANVVLGVAGAGIGNWMGGALGLGAFGTLGGFLVAMLGAMAVIAALKALKVYR